MNADLPIQDSKVSKRSRRASPRGVDGKKLSRIGQIGMSIKDSKKVMMVGSNLSKAVKFDASQRKADAY